MCVCVCVFQFSGDEEDKIKRAVGTFCSNQPSALELIKSRKKKDQKFCLFMQVRTRTGQTVLFVNSGQSQNQTRTSRLEASAHIFCFDDLHQKQNDVYLVRMVLTSLLVTSPSLSRRLRVTAGAAGFSSKTSFLLRCRDSPSTLYCWTTSPSTQVSPAQV